MKLTIESGDYRREYTLEGTKLRAFAHSMEHESHSGAEWEGLTEDQYGEMCDLFGGMAAVLDAWADDEDDEPTEQEFGAMSAEAEQERPSFIAGDPTRDNAVQIDGQILDPGPSLKLRNHSPTGFAWGYYGSGPAQLALAILLAVGATEAEAVKWYQHFKTEFVASWPMDRPFIQSASEVRAWLDDQRQAARVAA